MIRIFSFAASCAGQGSHTKRASDMLAEAVKEKAAEEGIEVNYECITGDQVRIDYCRSCQSCFKKGFCPLDEKDDMPMLKQKLLNADVIFLCTPIYLWEMSGMCKSLIDRLSYWTHRFELAGKTAVAIASTDTSTDPDFDKRFRDLIGFMGPAVAGGFTVRNYASPNLWKEDEMSQLMDKTAADILKAMRDPDPYITDMQKLAWKSRLILVKRCKRMKELVGIEPIDEVRVCMERRMDECSSLSDYINKLK